DGVAEGDLPGAKFEQAVRDFQNALGGDGALVRAAEGGRDVAGPGNVRSSSDGGDGLDFGESLGDGSVEGGAVVALAGGGDGCQLAGAGFDGAAGAELVGHQGDVGDAGRLRQGAKDGLGIGHLRDRSGLYERAGLDTGEACGDKAADELQLEIGV